VKKLMLAADLCVAKFVGIHQTTKGRGVKCVARRAGEFAFSTLMAGVT
jgi:hypothetical protein